MPDGPTDPRPPVEVAAGLVFRGGKVLITRRHATDHLGGMWEFPGGERKPAETFEECLKRELAEELGIEVEVGEVLETLAHAYPEKTVHLKFFLCRWKRHEPQLLDCLDFAWVGPGELKNYDFPAADTRLLQLLEGSPGLWR